MSALALYHSCEPAGTWVHVYGGGYIIVGARLLCMVGTCYVPTPWRGAGGLVNTVRRVALLGGRAGGGGCTREVEVK